MIHYRSSSLTPAFIAAIGVAWLLSATRPAAQTEGHAEHFTANAIDMNSGTTGRVEISVTRWSTPGEREALVTTLFKEGSDQLLEKLRDMRPVGRIYTPGSIGYELRYAEERKLPEGGRMIVLATDRPMGFYELVQQPRSAEYPFTWIQLNMKPDGTGEGRLAIAARVFADRPNRPIEIENFDIQPIRLEAVRSRTEN
jgi:hypothetical protein